MRRAQSPFKNVNFKRQSPVARYWQRIEQRRAIIEKIAVREKSADNFEGRRRNSRGNRGWGGIAHEIETAEEIHSEITILRIKIERVLQHRSEKEK